MPGISVSKICVPFGGGTDWSSYWATRLPYFALPATGVSLMVGQEITIYGDALISQPIGKDLTVTYTCDIGTQVGNNLVITPVAGDVGDHSLRAVFVSNGVTREDKTINLTVYAAAPAGAITVLMVGDSVLLGGAESIAGQIDTVLTPTITYIGTLGTTVLHEGRTGFRWREFVETGSPFVKAGVIDIPAYFTDNSLATPDYVFIRLGVNEAYANSNGELTALELTQIIDYSKDLIDGFLAFDASLKVIVGLPTICENSGAGWAANYDELTYLQDEYIEIIHQIWDELVTTYNEGAYDVRVSVSFESLFLDRDDGYPKTDGIHTNGVHPDTSGHVQLGTGLAIQINKEYASIYMPTGLAVTWEQDHAKIDFTDASGGTAQHEIWSSRNGAAYVLVTTLDAEVVTYNDATWQNESMNYRVRAKVGTWYSNYTSAVNIVTPLVFKSDQTTLNNITGNLNIAAGKTVNVNWGNGTDNDYTGNNVINKAYGVGEEANPYYVVISGDVDSITYLQFSANAKNYGDLTKWKLPTSAVTINLYNCSYTGNISGWVLPVNLVYFNVTQAATGGFTGDLSSWVIPAAMTHILAAQSSASRLSGDLSGWSLPATLLQFYVNAQDFTKLPRGAFVGVDAILGIYAYRCDCNTAEVDAFLVYVDNYFASVTPIKNAVYNLSSTGMGIPSATGLAAKAGIEAKYTAAGFTATITVNS